MAEALRRVIAAHTGADFESGRVHRARGVNEPQPGVEPEPAGPDPQEPPAGAPQAQRATQAERCQPGIRTFFGDRTTPAAPELVGAPGRQRPKKQKTQEQRLVRGQMKTIHLSGNVVENPDWVVITDVRNGNNHYECIQCGLTFWGHDGRVISHCLRIKGEGVDVCPRAPSDRCKTVLERARERKQAGKRAGSDGAVAHTASINAPDVMASREKMQADADQALAEWATHYDISGGAVDQRNKAFQNFLRKALLVGPTYHTPTQEVLMSSEARTGRQGGLYLAREQMQREKLAVLAGAEETGGTVASDGAKLSARKRGMLNTSLALPRGIEFIQQTDATGHRKDARFLADDLSRALEKCGTVSQVSVLNADGSIKTKRISSVAKIVIFDRGGGCVNALSLIEDEWVVLTDTCKTHLADLLLEDVGKPFKGHVKSVHEVIVFITSHDVPFGVFSGYDGVRALLIPAATRFATEVICVNSTLQDMQQIQRLFIDERVVAWVDKQPADVKNKFRKAKVLVLSDAWWHRSTVFVAVTQPVVTSLRFLDTGSPNLKDAAFSYEQLVIEFGEPLIGSLASIRVPPPPQFQPSLPLLPLPLHLHSCLASGLGRD